MAVKTPAPPVQTPREKARNFLGWAFVISIFIHGLAGPFIKFKEAGTKEQEVEKVSVTKKIKVVVPTPPPPTPTPPPPTPPPKSTPPPVKTTNPPPQPKLKLDVVKTKSEGKSSSAEHQYIAPKVGSQNGVPQGTVASAPPAPAATTAATAAPPPPPPPTPTPKPACAQPHVEPYMTRGVEPDYPEIARQQGAAGVAMVEVSLTAGGSVISARINKSAGFPALDQAALAAAKQSSFAPEIDNCVKVPGTYLFRAEFSSQ